MGMSFNPQDSGKLADGATAIQLTCLPAKLTASSCQEILDQFWPGCYDFVHVQRDKIKAKKMATALFNFSEHATACAAYAYFQGHGMDSRLGSKFRVCQAEVQGLSQNLACFIAKSGLSDWDGPQVPRVFENGCCINLLEAAEKHVTMQLLAEASERMKAIENPRARQNAPRGKLPKQDSRGGNASAGTGNAGRGYVPHVNHVKQPPGQRDMRDDSRSSTRVWAEGAGTDPGAASSCSSSHVQAKWHSSAETFDQRGCGLAEPWGSQLARKELPDGSICFCL